MQFDVIIIGAGAAGMMCAAQAGARGRRVLLVDRSDVFGNAVNRASKLGEDIGEGGETLITAGAYGRLPADAGINGRQTRMLISGIEIELISL